MYNSLKNPKNRLGICEQFLLILKHAQGLVATWLRANPGLYDAHRSLMTSTGIGSLDSQYDEGRVVMGMSFSGPTWFTTYPGLMSNTVGGGRNPVNSPVDIVNIPFIHKVLYIQTVVGNGISEPSTGTG